MRTRSTVAAIVLALGATLPLAGIANAQPDRDCPDFASQAEAQAALDSRAGDPERLDADDDGIACETHFGEPTSTATPRTTTPAPRTTAAPSNETDSGESDSSSGQVRTLPRGGVDTGDGSTVGDPVTAPALLALAGLGAVATTATAGTWRGRRSN
jgi:hypothetical protein